MTMLAAGVLYYSPNKLLLYGVGVVLMTRNATLAHAHTQATHPCGASRAAVSSKYAPLLRTLVVPHDTRPCDTKADAARGEARGERTLLLLSVGQVGIGRIKQLNVWSGRGAQKLAPCNAMSV